VQSGRERLISSIASSSYRYKDPITPKLRCIMIMIGASRRTLGIGYADESSCDQVEIKINELL